MAFIDISTLDPSKTIVVSTGNAHKVIEILPDNHVNWLAP